ncbi:hypothetical protein HPB47_002489 [Ixodes persulcatus]|uniref:Uncharacterized protein n=1 Tax=Ixodes persulcatus TaxID=34615 RepID=A0AC60PM26_IXOPE|nr:hypothetical protein HPB47_002489 [Ixodes persulcatus]
MPPSLSYGSVHVHLSLVGSATHPERRYSPSATGWPPSPLLVHQSLYYGSVQQLPLQLRWNAQGVGVSTWDLGT